MDNAPAHAKPALRKNVFELTHYCPKYLFLKNLNFEYFFD